MFSMCTAIRCFTLRWREVLRFKGGSPINWLESRNSPRVRLDQTWAELGSRQFFYLGQGGSFNAGAIGVLLEALDCG